MFNKNVKNVLCDRLLFANQYTWLCARPGQAQMSTYKYLSLI